MTLDQITTLFIRVLRAAALKIGVLAIARKRNIPVYVDKEIANLQIIFDDLFNSGRKVDVTMIKRKLLNLTNTYDLPLKYNKDLLAQINGKSVFTGYYDTRYKTVFSKRELYNLKNTILAGKYSGISEQELAVNIRNTINITKGRAQLLARTEVQRLRETTTQVYMQQPQMKKKYKRVWKNTGGNVRPAHVRMKDKVAADSGEHEGQFYSEDVGWVSGPGSGPVGFAINCKCRTELELRNKGE